MCACVTFTISAQGLFHVCDGCGSPLLFTYADLAILRQCCECGVILNGRYAGHFVVSNGAADTSLAMSHGICNACARAKLAARRKQLTTTEYYLIDNRKFLLVQKNS